MSTEYLIKPLETVTVWDDAEPIIPTVTKNVIITNNSSIELEIVNYWAPPSHIYYPDIKYWLAPYKSVLVPAPQHSFYYYRVNITNLDKCTLGSAIVDIF